MIEILVAAITALVSVFIYVLGRRSDRVAKNMSLKESRYIGFLEAMIASRAGEPRQNELNKTLQVIYLIGSVDVVETTKAFISFLVDSSGNSRTQDAKQDELYAKMLQAMKEDLYGKCASKDYPNSLGLTVFS